MEIPISNIQIEKAVGYEIPTILYNELYKYANIEDLFINNVCLIQYPDMNGSDIGHWIVLTDNNGLITFFDPYGDFIDYQFSCIDYPYISKLLLKYIDNGGKAEYNFYRLQKLKRGVNTCGRWCILWLWCYKDTDVDNFCDKLFDISEKHNIDLDLLVTYLTNKYI